MSRGGKGRLFGGRRHAKYSWYGSGVLAVVELTFYLTIVRCAGYLGKADSGIRRDVGHVVYGIRRCMGCKSWFDYSCLRNIEQYVK